MVLGLAVLLACTVALSAYMTINALAATYLNPIHLTHHETVPHGLRIYYSEDNEYAYVDLSESTTSEIFITIQYLIDNGYREYDNNYSNVTFHR